MNNKEMAAQLEKMRMEDRFCGWAALRAGAEALVLIDEAQAMATDILAAYNADDVAVMDALGKHHETVKKLAADLKWCKGTTLAEMNLANHTGDADEAIYHNADIGNMIAGIVGAIEESKRGSEEFTRALDAAQQQMEVVLERVERRERNVNLPLTMDELRERHGHPVWFVEHDKDRVHCGVVGANDDLLRKQTTYTVSFTHGIERLEDALEWGVPYRTEPTVADHVVDAAEMVEEQQPAEPVEYVRVQEYVLDMGVFHKHCIHSLPLDEYHTYRGRLVILPEDDYYGAKLPIHIRSEEEMDKLIKQAWRAYRETREEPS